MGPGYRRRALTLLETLCEVAASGKHRRLYQQITAEVVNSTQDLAHISALELASKKKIKRKSDTEAPPTPTPPPTPITFWNWRAPRRRL